MLPFAVVSTKGLLCVAHKMRVPDVHEAQTSGTTYLVTNLLHQHCSVDAHLSIIIYPTAGHRLTYLTKPSRDFS